MKLAVVLFVCGIAHFCAAQEHHDKHSCSMDHNANIAKLEEWSHEINSMIASFKHNLNCEKRGREHNPASSCKDVPLSSRSGEHWIRPKCGDTFHAWCDMSRRYDGASKGWMRVADWDMRNAHHTCPAGWTMRTWASEPRRTCGRTRDVGCESWIFPVNGTEYSKVCGRVRAYQWGSPDGWHRHDHSWWSLDNNYVDGVSITHGWPTRRAHIWTMAASWTNASSEHGCPCATTNWQWNKPSFMGNHWFCETGHRNEWAATMYPDPLWDGMGCDHHSTCCTWNNPPWFCRDLPHPTTEDIELRLCGDQPTSDEDTPIESVELWVH